MHRHDVVSVSYFALASYCAGEYQNTGWEVIEYSQPLEEISDSDFEYTVANREKVIRMITIAHTNAVPCEFLGFEMDEVAMPWSHCRAWNFCR